MKKEEISTLSILDKMSKDDNKGIRMSTTITSVSNVSQGAIIGFGVENFIGDDVKVHLAGLPGEYMVFCMAVSRKELEKTRQIMQDEAQHER